MSRFKRLISRRHTIETLEKRQLLAGDLGRADDHQAIVAIAEATSEPLPLRSFAAAEGEETSASEAGSSVELLDFGFQSSLRDNVLEPFSVNYDLERDQLLIHATGRRDSFEIRFQVETLTDTGERQIQELSFATGFGISGARLLQNVSVEPRVDGSFLVRVSNFLETGPGSTIAEAVRAIDPELSVDQLHLPGNLTVLRGPAFPSIVGDDEVVPEPSVVELQLADLTDSDIVVQFPSVVRKGAELELPFQILEGASQTRGQVQAARFTRSDGDFVEVSVSPANLSGLASFQLPADNFDSIELFSVELLYQNGISRPQSVLLPVFPAGALEGEFLSNGGLFSLDAFDLVSIDDLFRSTSTQPNGPEVRFGAIQGQVSPLAADGVNNETLRDLRLRVIPSVDTRQGIETEAYAFQVTPEDDGFFAFHVEDKLNDSVGDDFEQQLLSPRLTAESLILQLVGSDGQVLDQLQFERADLVRLLNQGLLPSPDEFARPLDVDLFLDDDESLANPDNSTGTVRTNILVHNAELISRTLPDNAILRVEVDFGDESDPVVRNLLPSAFRSSARLETVPDFFVGTSDVLRVLEQSSPSSASALRRHTYAAPGEYEIVVTATLGNQTSVAKRTVIINEATDRGADVDDLRLQSEFVDEATYGTSVSALLTDFAPPEGTDFSPSVRLKIGEREADGIVRETIEVAGSQGTRHRIEALVTGINLRDFEGTQVDEAGFVQLPIEVTFFNGDGIAITRTSTLQIQIAELISIGFENRTGFRINLDAGVRTPTLIVDFTNLPIEFQQRFDSGGDFETVRATVNVTAEAFFRNEIDGLARLALEKHFGGAANIPSTVDENSAVIQEGDQAIGIAVFASRDVADGTPPDQAKGARVFQQQFVNRELQKPFLDFDGFLENLLQFSDGEAFVEGGLRANLFASVRVVNGTSTVRVSSPDGSLGFPNVTTLEQTTLNAGNRTQIAGRRSGPATLLIESVDEDLRFELDTFVAPGAIPLIRSGTDELDEDDFSPRPDATVEERTVSLGFVRGESGVDPRVATILQQLSGENDAAFNLSQGDGDAVTTGIHRVTIDWGDGASDDVVLRPVLPGIDDTTGSSASVQHTFSAEFLRELERTRTLVNRELRTFGAITIRVDEITEGGELIRQGDVRRLNYFGQRVVPITFGPDANDADTQTIRSEIRNSFVEELPGSSSAPRELSQIRKEIVGRNIDGFRFSSGRLANEAFFDFTVDLGDGRIFRVLRDQTDADQVFGIFVRPFARLFRNAEATGEPERIRLDGSTIEFSDSQTFAPLVGFDEVGHYEIKVSQPAGLVIDGLSEPTEELVGFTDLVVLPEVDVEINADGSLSGTIASPVTSRRVLGDTRLRVSAIDSPNGVPPIEVSLADQDGFELTQAFVQEFLVAGRRLQIDVLYRDGTASENSQQIVTRVFTPNPKQDIEDITNFVVDGDPIQLNPLIVSFQLAPATVARAEAATNELPFRLTVSPGGGLNDIVLVRNDDTADGTFDVEGSDVSVPFFADGTITLMDGVFGTGLTEYSNPGTHTFRVFSECSFGSTEIRIADIPPSVVDPPEIESDLFGNITITGRIDAQQPVRINVDAPSNDPNGLPTELFEETVDASGQAFEVGFNSGGVRAGDRLDFKFTELESGLQTTRIIQNVRVQKRVFDVGLETEFDDQGAASLTLDLNELLRAALAGAEARFDAGSSDGGAPIEATRFSFAIQLGSEGATIPVEATAAVSNRGQAAFVRVGEESFSFGPDEIRDNRATLKIPVAFAQTGEVTVSISDEDECLTGSTPVNVPEIVNVPSDLSATLQPNGTTRILGKRPFGSNASIDLNIGGEDIVVEFDEEAAIFAFDIEGLPAGNTISASINGGPTVEATVEVKLGADHAQVPLRFVEDPDNPGERLVEVDFRKAAELLFAGVNEGERFTVSFDLGLVPIVISGSVSSSGERLIAAEIESFVGFVNLDEVFTVPAALIESAINPVDGQAEFRLDDVKLCIEGRTVFAVDESGRLIGLTASQRILVDVPAGGERTGTGSIQFATDNPANPDVSITSTGLNLIIGDVVVEEGDTRIVPAAVLEQNPEFTFEDAGGVGDKRIEFEIPDPNDENQTIRLASEVFFIGAFEPEPCEEHPSFPDGRVFGGDVTFVFADGNLTLSGDDENNGVAVFGDERGVVIQPIGGTTLNGSSEAVVIVEGVQTIDGELVVTTLGLGDDLLCLENLRITRTTDITSTPGDDVVLASGVDFDQLVRLDVGSGDDVIDLTGSTSDIGFQVSLGDGDDLFLGSDSPDFVSGGAGADTIYGAGGDDRLTGDAGADVQRGGDGNDTFFWNDGDGPDDNFGEGGGFDAFVMFGADGAADEVRLAPSDDEGETGDGTHPSPDFDVTTTLPTAFTIELSGVEVSDISGLGGNDQIDASAIPDGLLTALSLSGNNGDDVLQGSQGADFLVGGAGSDVLIGNQGNDDGFGEFFFGPDQDADEPGDDLFIWNNGDGADNFVGNEGADTFRFNGADGANDEVEVTPGGDDGDFEADGPLGASVDLIRSQPTPFTIETISIENFEVNGLGGDDRIDASALNSALLTSLILGGGTGNDELIGSAIDDTLNGDEGDDTLIGFLGADRQFGGSGNDLFVWNDGDGPDDNFGGSGDDTFRFNGADGADDELRIAPADDIGAVGDGTHSNPDFDLTRRAPSAFTIENGDIENAEINGLGGDDEFNVSSLSSGAVDLLLSGGTGDDTFVVADLINKVIAGGIGTDRLLAEGDGATIDFDAASDASISGISRIELDPNARNSLSLDPESVARVAGNDADLTIRADADDAIDIGDGWDTQRPQTIDELFHQVFVVEQRSIKVSSGRPFQNVESHSDVNADGRITPLDALLIINALRRARTSPVILDDNRPTDGISDFLFEDVNGDGLISPLDALQVINDLSR